MENFTLLDAYLYITMSIKSLSMTFQLVHKYQPLYRDVSSFHLIEKYSRLLLKNQLQNIYEKLFFCDPK